MSILGIAIFVLVPMLMCWIGTRHEPGAPLRLPNSGSLSAQAGWLFLPGLGVVWFVSQQDGLDVVPVVLAGAGGVLLIAVGPALRGWRWQWGPLTAALVVGAYWYWPSDVVACLAATVISASLLMVMTRLLPRGQIGWWLVALVLVDATLIATATISTESPLLAAWTWNDPYDWPLWNKLIWDGSALGNGDLLAAGLIGLVAADVLGRTRRSILIIVCGYGGIQAGFLLLSAPWETPVPATVPAGIALGGLWLWQRQARALPSQQRQVLRPAETVMGEYVVDEQR